TATRASPTPPPPPVQSYLRDFGVSVWQIMVPLHAPLHWKIFSGGNATEYNFGSQIKKYYIFVVFRFLGKI
ncbi:MAG: hypothetical protein ACO3NW_10535, partial [Kiritimatiellia bacterium]